MLPHRCPLVPRHDPDLPDTSLMQLVALRDEAALAILYQRYARRAYAIAMRITDNPETAEEVVQDVFQHVWQSASSFQGGDRAVAPWVSGIARHRAIDAMRSKLGRARAREWLLAEHLPSGTESDGACVVEHAQLCAAIQAALATLPHEQRHAIELAYFRGLTCREIADRLDASVGTIKTRVRLGLVKLRSSVHESWI